MTWQPYAITAFVLLVLAGAAGLLNLTGVDFKMFVGLATGGGIGVLVAVVGIYSMFRGLAEKSKKLALGHMFGGFFLRLVVVVVGVLGLAFTGWGNPVGFAIAFMVTLALYMGLQLYWVSRKLTANARARAAAA